MRVMRSRCSMPRALAVKAIAEHLGTTQSYLLTGIDEDYMPEERKEIPEVEFVRNNTKAQSIVRILMQRPRLLEEIYIAISNIENKNNSESIK